MRSFNKGNVKLSATATTRTSGVKSVPSAYDYLGIA